MRNKPCLSLTDVKKILAVCESEAIKNQWAVSISVVDDGGYLLGFVRMDGAGPATFEASLGKARTSGMTRRPSKIFEDRVKERPGFVTFPAGILIQGGVPILHESTCVGGIGVSGVLSHEDELIAFAGAKALD